MCLSLAIGLSMMRITSRKILRTISARHSAALSRSSPILNPLKMKFQWKIYFWIGNNKMPNQFDILIKHARLRGKPDSLVDIGISQGHITALEENLAGEAKTLIDAEENLVTESFVNPHLHLCKVYTLQMMGEEALTSYQGEGMGKAMT